MQQLFFTADLHLGHANIAKHCARTQFLTAEEHARLIDGTDLHISPETTRRMDEALLDNINATVPKDAQLWLLGDFCWCSDQKAYDTIRAYRDRIVCDCIHLVVGNHDRPACRAVFHQNTRLTTLTINSQKVVLCHYPLAIWHCRHYGAWHLYGHSHGTAEGWLDKIMPGRFSMDVGVDHAKQLLGEYRPFAFSEIAARMATRPGFGLKATPSNGTDFFVSGDDDRRT